MESSFPTNATNTTPAPYGSACENCSHAKCKCMRRLGGGSCERCHRLNKECRQPAAVRKRVTKRSYKSRTEQIEKKLDGLISMLNASPEGSTESPSLQHSTDGSSLGCVDNTPAAGVAENLEQNSFSPKATTVPGSSHVHSPINYGVPEVTPSEAEECLYDFRTYKLNYFPFYNIPSAMTAQELCRERPFFWRCITAVSCGSAAKQVALLEDVRRLIAQTMVMEHNRNIDMILGLLVIMGWPSYQILSKPFMGLYVHLALAMVRDLGLNKPAATEPPRIFQSLKMAPGAKWSPSVRSNEERRAVLGCFFISSTISSYLQKTAALSWTSHLDECMRVLAAEDNCPNDQILIQLVRSQLIVEKISQIPRHEADDWASHGRNGTPFLPFYLKEIESQLEGIKNLIPAELQHDKVVLLHYYSTENFVHELALLSKEPMLPDDPEDFNRMRNLCACLQTAKSWFDLIFSIPPAYWIAFPFTIFSQMSRLLMNLFRLSTLDDPAWDNGLVRNSLDILQVLNRLIEMMRETSQQPSLVGNHSEVDVFTRGGRMLQYLKQTWEDSLLATVPAQASEPRPLEDVASEHVQNPPSFPMDLFDEALMADIWGGLDS